MKAKKKIWIIMAILTLLLGSFGAILRNATTDFREAFIAKQASKRSKQDYSLETIKNSKDKPFKLNKNKAQTKTYQYVLSQTAPSRKITATYMPEQSQTLYFDGNLGQFDKVLVQPTENIENGTPIFQYQVHNENQNEIAALNEQLQTGVSLIVSLDEQIENCQNEINQGIDNEAKRAQLNNLQYNKKLRTEENAKIMKEIGALEQNQGLTTKTVLSTIAGTVTEVSGQGVMVRTGDDALQFVLPAETVKNYPINQKVNLKNEKTGQEIVGTVANQDAQQRQITVKLAENIKDKTPVTLIVAEMGVILPKATILSKQHQSYVFIYHKGTIKQQKVTIISEQNQQVKVTGIRKKQKVILSPEENFKDGMKLKAREREDDQ